MKLMIFLIPVALMLALLTSPVAAQSVQVSPDLANLINNAHANYQSNPESAVNIYLVPDMGDNMGIFSSGNPTTPFPAFNEHYQVPDVFAAFNQQIPTPIIF